MTDKKQAKPKKIAINKETIGTAHLNGAFEHHFKAYPTSPKTINSADQIRREENAYRRYRNAVGNNKLPYSAEVKRAMQLYPNLKQEIIKRRIMVLFQHGLPNREGEARGYHKTPGNIRGKKGEKLSYGDVLILNTDLLKSPLAIGAILDHEMGHVTWREDRHNDKPIPEPVGIDGDESFISTEENWCDYRAGKFLYENGYRKGGPMQKEWGDMTGFKGIMNYKLHFFIKGAPVIRKRQGNIQTGAVHVSGYTRSDGVEVKSHTRSRPAK